MQKTHVFADTRSRHEDLLIVSTKTYKSQSNKSSNKIGFRKLVHNNKVKQKKIGRTGTRRGPEIETNTYDYIAMSPCAM